MIRQSLIVALVVIALAPALRAQVVITDLRADRNDVGDVVLSWTPPQGVIISQYKIWRKLGSAMWTQAAELHASTVRQYTDPYPGLVPNGQYFYFLEAVDIIGNVGGASVEIKLTPPPGSLEFSTAAPTTGQIGSMYFYSPRIAGVTDHRDIEFSFVTFPDGMALDYIADGIPRIAWTPNQAGYYPVTLIARNKRTNARGIQEFAIRVSSAAGVVRGRVFSSSEARPIAGAVVRINHVRDGMTYEIESDATGTFELPNVQAGELYAFCRASGNSFAPQWYPLGRSLTEVAPRILRANDTLVYEFYLVPIQATKVRIGGTVRSTSGFGIAGARVAFVRKHNYFHIGDTSIISNPGYYASSFGYDTVVTSGADGSYEAWLPAGAQFYPIVSAPSHLNGFNADQNLTTSTNALQSRAFLSRDGLGSLDFTLAPVAIRTSNVIEGTVSNIDNGVSKQAIVVLIDSELKRGAGGGHTYRRYISVISDENGRYTFDNLPFSTAYSILAIPLDRQLAPQYFTSTGGSTEFRFSEDIAPVGAVQNVNFQLPTARTDGIGTIYGRVMVREQQQLRPAPGALVFARRPSTGTIWGYAVSDSAGWYSIPGLPAGEYRVHVDHTAYGSAPSAQTALQYQDAFRLFNSTRQLDFVIESIATSVPVVPDADGYALLQNYPNPFNPGTTIRFALPREEMVTVRVLDALGREISVLHHGRLAPGSHSVTFDGSVVPSGTYFYQLQAGSRTLTRSMMLMK